MILDCLGWEWLGPGTCSSSSSDVDDSSGCVLLDGGAMTDGRLNMGSFYIV